MIMIEQNEPDVMLQPSGQTLTRYLRTLSEPELDQMLNQYAHRDQQGMPSESFWDFICRKKVVREQGLSTLGLDIASNHPVR
jgi:hypothetical protein